MSNLIFFFNKNGETTLINLKLLAHIKSLFVLLDRSQIRNIVAKERKNLYYIINCVKSQELRMFFFNPET